MKTTAIFFPFDLFGSGGCAAGVGLLADELREVLADNRRESVPTRARAYTDHVKIREASFATTRPRPGCWPRSPTRARSSASG